MKIYHLDYNSDMKASLEQARIEALDGVLEASTHQAWGHGPAYLVVVTQDDFDPKVFQRGFSLMYEENAVDAPNPLKNKKSKKSEIEVPDGSVDDADELRRERKDMLDGDPTWKEDE